MDEHPLQNTSESSTMVTVAEAPGDLAVSITREPTYTSIMSFPRQPPQQAFTSQNASLLGVTDNLQPPGSPGEYRQLRPHYPDSPSKRRQSKSQSKSPAPMGTNGVAAAKVRLVAQQDWKREEEFQILKQSVKNF